MKAILTSALLASALFCLAAPINNNYTKHDHKAIAAKAKLPDDNNNKSDSQKPKDDAKAKAKAKAEKADKYSTNNVWNNNNGGGRTSYH
jgi:hypothetical protein